MASVEGTGVVAVEAFVPLLDFLWRHHSSLHCPGRLKSVSAYCTGRSTHDGPLLCRPTGLHRPHKALLNLPSSLRRNRIDVLQHCHKFACFLQSCNASRANRSQVIPRRTVCHDIRTFQRSPSSPPTAPSSCRICRRDLSSSLLRRISNRPPGFNTRRPPATRGPLSAVRLMTQFEMITSPIVGQRNISMRLSGTPIGHAGFF